MDTTSPALARFLAAQQKLNRLKTERDAAEQRARQLRVAEQVARGELRDAQLALERLDPEGQSGGRHVVGSPPEPEPPPSPPPAAPAHRQRREWSVGRRLPASLGPLLEVLSAADGTLSFSQLHDRLPELASDLLRGRVSHGKKIGLIATEGWGQYCLSDLGKRALQGGLRVVE